MAKERQAIKATDVKDLTNAAQIITRQAHEVFVGPDAPIKVRVNMPDGTPKDIARDDTATLEAHGIVACSNCGAPNHAAQLNVNEQPWIQCGCNGQRMEVRVGKEGRAHITAHREAMIAAVNEGRPAANRG